MVEPVEIQILLNQTENGNWLYFMRGAKNQFIGSHLPTKLVMWVP